MEIYKNLTLYNMNKDKSLKPIVFFIEDKSIYSYPFYKELNCICAVTCWNESNQELNTYLILLCALFLTISVFSQICEQLIILSIIDMFLFFTFLLFNVLSSNHCKSMNEILKQIEWVYNNIEQYGGDKNKIIIIGNYYGAQIGSLIVTNDYYLTQVKIPKDCLKGFIGCNGIYSDKRLQRPKTCYELFPIYNITNKTPPHLLLNIENNVHLKKHTLDYHFALLSKSIYVKSIYFSKYKPMIKEMEEFIQDIFSHSSHF